MGYLIGWGIWGILILLVAGILFWSAVLPKITSKRLSFVMISLGFNVISIPMSLFVGGMATASPTSTMNDFWIGFLIAQATPLLVLIIAILKWFIIDIRKIKKRVNSNN
ncbi:hypothetical protein EP18_18505 [Lysinibacillus sphaericus]|nr:hypothetical protein [Lysinibacillus sphaericus]KEK10286.1 hypothetical protein EP18_18505 [Lysinibacillus sphaericus]